VREQALAPGAVIGVDTGGTFTDVFTSDGRIVKVLSSPDNPVEAVMTGLEQVGLEAGDAVGHGTTVATNAVLERKGARTALLTTAGFEDVLAIRRQNRPAIYNLFATWPDPLVGREARIGVPERLDWTGAVLEPLTPAGLADAIDKLKAVDPESVAICLLFSYANPRHELLCAAEVKAALGDVPVSMSHVIAPRLGEFERTSTTVLNAYLMPTMQRYLTSLEKRLSLRGVTQTHVMQSNGGLVGAADAAAKPVHTILSGPAAGVVGARAVASQAGHDRVITFDMGGTSTDVAVVAGSAVEADEGEIELFPVLIPMLAIETVGAGGGSIARVDAAGGLRVGPGSAGAQPGPAAYGRGNLPTVTDANLALGRVSPEGLLSGSIPLDLELARSALETIARPLGLSVEQAAWAVIRLANSTMERAVRRVMLGQSHDPRRFTLVPCGGAGPLHAAELADGLGITSILVPPHPGVMAAVGLTVPDLVREYGRTVLLREGSDQASTMETAFAALETEALQDTGREALFGDAVLERSLDVRYVGQSFHLRVPYAADPQELRVLFTERYQERYGYSLPAEPLEVVTGRVRATLPRLHRPRLTPDWPEAERAVRRRAVYFGFGLQVGTLQGEETAVLWRSSLAAGTSITGPAVIEQYDATTLLPPGWTARVDDRFNLLLARS
jgi:N-methylhydantoinase A